MPPFFCASAITCSAMVVLPEDSGPKISMMRPRGNPPTPSAASSEIEPVEITATGTMASFDPSRRIEPFPNCFSIWLRARSKARARSFSSMPGKLLSDGMKVSLYQWGRGRESYKRFYGARRGCASNAGDPAAEGGAPSMPMRSPETTISTPLVPLDGRRPYRQKLPGWKLPGCRSRSGWRSEGPERPGSRGRRRRAARTAPGLYSSVPVSSARPSSRIFRPG